MIHLGYNRFVDDTHVCDIDTVPRKMNTQHLKRKLEDKLGRYMSDSTWYRLRKNLHQAGIPDDNFLAAFELIAAMNKGKTSRKARISFISSNFIDIWKKVQSLSSSQQNLKCSCSAFRKMLEEEMEYKPRDRYCKGKYIGINTMWYRWFSDAGCPYSSDETYTLKELMGVAANAFSWNQKQVEKYSLSKLTNTQDLAA